MIRPRAHARLLVAGLIAATLPGSARAQGWFADVSAGQVAYERSAVDIGTNQVTGTLRYDTQRGTWVYGTAGAPLGSGDPAWGAFGGHARLTSAAGGSRVLLGVDAAAHGYLFRDPAAAITGSGGTLEAFPFVSLPVGAVRLEPRGGWRGHALSFGGSTLRRGVVEAGLRASHGTRLRVQADMRWIRAPEGTYPFAGGSVVYSGSRLSWWLQAARGLRVALDDASWGAGASVALGAHTAIWASARQDAPDPLYWNASRRVWSVGVTRRLGGSGPGVEPVSRTESGGALIRVRASDVPGGAVSVAGSFNGWQPVPMRREGPDWVVSLPLAPGVYHYAFRVARGAWFVPASVASRRDDGMGGYVAVLVVQ